MFLLRVCGACQPKPVARTFEQSRLELLWSRHNRAHFSFEIVTTCIAARGAKSGGRGLQSAAYGELRLLCSVFTNTATTGNKKTARSSRVVQFFQVPSG